MTKEEHAALRELHTHGGWFKGEPTVREKVMVPVRQEWACPVEGCNGSMVFNGFTWPTGTPGYHHTCDKCEFTAAARGERFPRTIYREPQT
jgi:hypothetical protein